MDKAQGCETSRTAETCGRCQFPKSAAQTSEVLRSVIRRSRQRILVSADITAQCETMLDNVETLLGEVGLELKHLVRTVLYLTDDADVVR